MNKHDNRDPVLHCPKCGTKLRKLKGKVVAINKKLPSKKTASRNKAR